MSDTVCQTCVFAKKYGCNLGIIDNARAAGITVLECWNEGGEFNVIPDHQCMYHRPVEWANKSGLGTNLIDRAAKEIESKFSAFVVCDETSTFDDIQRTVLSLASQELKPDLVVVIKEAANKVDSGEIFKFINTLGFNEWKIEGIVDPDRHGRMAVELALKWKPRPYFATFRAGRIVRADFFSELNEKITKHFFSFGIMSESDDEIDGVVVARVVLMYFKNQFDGLELLIEREEKKCQNQILETPLQ